MATHHRWALAAVAVAGVSVLSVQQTGALWSDSASSSGATISSGVLEIAVGDGQTQSSEFDFGLLAGTDMVSGEFAQRPLHVQNSGSVPMLYRLVSAAPSNASLPLELQVTAVSSEADCPASEDAVGPDPLFDGAVGSAVTDNRLLEEGLTEILCFRVTMGDDPPAGEEGTVVFTFEATQS